MKQFKTESKRILDLMINSIYTNKEIFLRELISNASDAIDKRHFASLTDGEAQTEFKIEITPDKEKRTLTVSDNGIGMTAEELEKNLGTIAESGTLAFKKAETDENELIGQFGVGFYSAFMVADKIEVLSRKNGQDSANLWTSRGAEGYTVTAGEKEEVGTTITLYLKNKDEDFDYDQLLEEFYLRMLIKKYSDYIRYPIVMETTKSRQVETAEGEEKKYETYREKETINSRTPLWKRQKSELKKEDYDQFYKAKFHDFTEPIKTFHFNIEGLVNYTALLFIPEKTPFDYYQKDYKKGLQLYSNGVLIMDKCEELLPDSFGFIKGVVDSPDLSLNISREILQQDRQLRAIASGLEKKIVSELKKFMENDRESYDKFFNEFGLSVKIGIYNDFGAKKDSLKDLVEFYSSTEEKLVTLAEYVKRMKEDQKFIYYACGSTISSVDRLPNTELLKEKGFEILYMTDAPDEFVVKILGEYDGKQFCSVGAKDLGIDSEEDKKEIEEKAEESKELLEFIKDALDGEVTAVRLSARLKSRAVCLTADGEVSLEMERVFKRIKTGTQMPVLAEKVLEINPDHKLYEKLKGLFETDKEKLKKYASVIFTQALITEGLAPEDTSDFTQNLIDILSE